MPINSKYIEDFVEDNYMHLICRSVSNTPLFNNDDNRLFFLNKYANYSCGYLDTFCYILLDNHVHWLVKCKSAQDLQEHITSIADDARKIHQKKFLNGDLTFAEAIEFQLKDFFIAYAMAFNKRYKRSGALFINPFRRVAIKNEEHLTQVVIYQHANALKHGIHKDFENYKWSSYRTILSDKSTLLKRDELLQYFGGKEQFIKMHKEMVEFHYSHSLSLE